MHGPMGESSYTKEITTLIKYIHSNSAVKDSLIEQATLYFEDAEQQISHHKTLAKQVEESKIALTDANITNKTKLTKELQAVQASLAEETKQQKLAQKSRQERVFRLCETILFLGEGVNEEETRILSAKLLGTLLLLSPHEGSKLPELHQKFKPAYKAILALRLLDKLLAEGIITNKYILEKYQSGPRFSEVEKEMTVFQRDVCIPIIMAALIQDIGLQHPKAQQILRGPQGDMDPFRVLENDERLNLLKINYQQSLNFLVHGVGLMAYSGNSRQEKTEFDLNEKARMQFCRLLLSDSVKPKLGEGNLLKIPQVYSSVIFSTKQQSNLANLPKATLVLEKAAQMKSIDAAYTEHFIAIVGHFPQGFGITYIPKDEENQDLERYEYAIVYALYPKNLYVPICRTATRHLTFNSVGKRIAVPIENNLYFASTRKKFSNISPERLQDILSKLCSNFEERKDLDLIPSHWNPYGYFCYQKFQNLWKKSK